MKRNEAGCKGNTNLFHFVTFHYTEQKVTCFTQTAFFYYGKTDFNLFTSLKIAKRKWSKYAYVIFRLKIKTFFYNQIEQWCRWNTLRLRKYHMTSYLILQDLKSSCHLQGPWDSDIMPQIICVLQLKFWKAILLKMRCCSLLPHPIQCLNSREVAGTSVNIVAGVWGRLGMCSSIYKRLFVWRVWNASQRVQFFEYFNWWLWVQDVSHLCNNR